MLRDREAVACVQYIFFRFYVLVIFDSTVHTKRRQ